MPPSASDEPRTLSASVSGTKRLDREHGRRSPSGSAAIEARLDAPRVRPTRATRPDSEDRAARILRPWLADIYGSPRRAGAKKAFAWADRLAGLGSQRQDAGTGPHGAHRVRAALRASSPRPQASAAERRRTTCSTSSKACPAGAVRTSGSHPRSRTPIDRLVTPPTRSAWRTSSRRRGQCSTGSRAAAPASLRKGPRGGGRDRDKMIGHVIEADHALRPGDRRPTARAPPRRAARRSKRNGPRCSRSCDGHRTAARSRNGSGRSGTRRGGSRGTRSITPGRWRTAPTRASSVPSGIAVADAASATTSSGDRPAARSSRTPVSPADFESLLPSGRRTSGWWANAGGAPASERPSEPDLRGASPARRSSPRTTRSTPWRRSSTTTQNPYVQLPCRSRTGRSPFAATSPWRSPTMRSVHDSCPPPSVARITGPPTPRSRHSPGQPGPDQGRPCSAAHCAKVARVQSQP